AAATGSGAEAGGLTALASISTTRDVSASIAAALACGACVVGTAGHPESQTTDITSAAAAAPVIAAMIAEAFAGEGPRDGRSGSEPAPAFWVSPVTSDASRSMVGGARLGRPESGVIPVSSGLSSTIATVPCLLLPDLTRFGTPSVLIESEPRL